MQFHRRETSGRLLRNPVTLFTKRSRNPRRLASTWLCRVIFFLFAPTIISGRIGGIGGRGCCLDRLFRGGKNGRCNILGMEERGRYESRMKARCHILDLLARLSRWNRSNGENGWDDINAWKQCLITAWMGKRSVNKWTMDEERFCPWIVSFFFLSFVAKLILELY